MRRLAGLSLLAAALAATAAPAQDTTEVGVRIGLTYAAGTKPGVVVLPIAGDGGEAIRAIIQRDFDYGDRITVIGASGEGFPPSLVNAQGQFSYPVFARLGAAALVQVTPTSAGLHVAVHDVAKQRVAQVRDFAVPAAGAREWRLAIHAVSDEVERWITGVQGIAATRVVFARRGQVWMIDSDGEAARVISGDEYAVSPAWHPQGTHVAFSVLRDDGWQIAVRDLERGTTRAVRATAGGLNITPVFSPQGDVLVWAHGEEAGMDLFATAAFTDTPARRLTVGRGSDNTSPSFSPDGRRITFMSGRTGHPEVYISDADGTNVDLLTDYAGERAYRASPDWSPDGRAIAFMSRVGGRFQIMTIAVRGRAVKQHTSEGENEDPSWAPDGRHLVFSSTRGGTKQLYVLDTESGRVRQLTTGSVSRLPAWSPPLRWR